jgi:hypothetical protein
MKKRHLIFIFVLVMFFIIYKTCKKMNSDSVDSNRVELIGSYVLDVNKTDLSNYSKNIYIYKSLTLNLNGDSTFRLNMDVPFIYDSTGTWRASGNGIDEWNYLKFQKNKSFETPFSRFWSSDSIIYLNSTTPKKGFQNIGRVYFKKIVKP